MSEVSLAGEDHRHTVLVGRGDNLFVSHGTTRFDNPNHTGGTEGVDTIAKREEPIGSDHRALCPRPCLLQGTGGGPDPGLVTRTDSYRGSITGNDDCIRLGVRGDYPRKAHVVTRGVTALRAL